MGNGRGIDLSVPLDADERVALLARLERQTRRSERGCWEWTGYRRNQYGHGALSVHDYPVYVHHLSFAIHHGVIAEGVVIRHTCDNPPCWRPEHLEPGSQLDNIADMRARDRATKPPRRAGATHHRATLTDAQVAELRALAATGRFSQRAIAQRFGVSQSAVWNLVHERTRRAVA